MNDDKSIKETKGQKNVSPTIRIMLSIIIIIGVVLVLIDLLGGSSSPEVVSNSAANNFLSLIQMFIGFGLFGGLLFLIFIISIPVIIIILLFRAVAKKGNQ